MTKYYVIKLREENRERFFISESYITTECYDGLDEIIKGYGDTTILISPSKELAESVKNTLNGELQE